MDDAGDLPEEAVRLRLQERAEPSPGRQEKVAERAGRHGNGSPWDCRAREGRGTIGEEGKPTVVLQANNLPPVGAGARRDLLGVLPKVKQGGFIQVNDYTPWSVLSGFPYGVMANVNEILNQGLAKVVEFGWQPFGHHDVLLAKP